MIANIEGRLKSITKKELIVCINSMAVCKPSVFYDAGTYVDTNTGYNVLDLFPLVENIRNGVKNIVCSNSLTASKVKGIQ